MIILIPVNGLFNRIRSILSSYLIAKDMKCRLVVLWIPEKNICNCLYEDILKNNNLWDFIPSNKINLFIRKNNININTIPKYLNIINGICYLRGFDKGEQFFMKKFMSSPCQIKIMKAGGNFHNPDITFKEYNKLRSKLYEEVRFLNDITSKVPKTLPNTLGIHLRYGDMSSSTNKINIIPSIDNFLLKNKIENIILISDDINKREECRDILNEKYSNLNISTSKIENSNRNEIKCLQDSIVDWLTLTKCDHLIFFSGSSFGFEAYIANMNRPVDEIPEHYLLKK